MERGCAEAGLYALSHSLAHGRLPRTTRTPGSTRECEGSALAVDLAAYGLVFTRGTPPRTEGCRTAGRGLWLSLMTWHRHPATAEPTRGPRKPAGPDPWRTGARARGTHRLAAERQRVAGRHPALQGPLGRARVDRLRRPAPCRPGSAPPAARRPARAPPAPPPSSAAPRRAPGRVSPSSSRRATSALYEASAPRSASTGTSSRPTSRGSKVSSATLPSADHPDPGGGGGGQLVEAVVAAEDQRGVAALGEHARDDRRHPRVGDADGLGPHPGRVGQRAEEVERGADAQLPARRRRHDAAPGGTSPRSRR